MINNIHYYQNHNFLLIENRVYERNPDLLAEMYAYSIAAAHEYLPHYSVTQYMVSNVDDDDGEGWKWVDNLKDDVCIPPKIGGEPTAIKEIPRITYYEGKPVPNVVHFCQFFRIGEYGFHKKRIQPAIFNCDFPLLVEPPLDVGKLRYKNRDGEVRIFKLY